MAVSDIISGIQLMKDLVNWAGENRDRALNSSAGDPHLLHHALSTIHFDDDGVLSVLRDLAQGAALRPGHTTLLLDFSYAGPDVGGALRHLSDAFSDAAGLSIRQRKALRALIPVKSAVRVEVGRLFVEETGFGTDVDPADAAALVEKIEDLNAAIEDIDETLAR